MRSRGFTRIELIAVVAMLAMLAGWGGLALRHHWARSRQAVCVGNLKQLGQAFLLCAQTKELLPRSAPLGRMMTNDWLFWQSNRLFQESAIAAYYENLKPERVRCPQDVESPSRSYAFSYSMNEHLSQRRLLREGPAGVILLAEEARPNDGSWAPGNPADLLTPRHDGLANVVFGDGHVQRTPPRQPQAPPRPPR